MVGLLEATGGGPVIDRTPPLTDIRKGFQFMIDGTLTGGEALPQGPARAPQDAGGGGASADARPHGRSAELHTVGQLAVRGQPLGYGGGAAAGTGADQQRTAEDGGRLGAGHNGLAGVESSTPVLTPPTDSARACCSPTA